MATVTQPIRRLRRTSYVTDEKEWLFHERVRLDLETGVGAPDGTDPKVMLRWSDDGGHVWSKEHWRSAGKIGMYRARAVWHRLGRSRQRIYELVFSEASKAVILGAEIEIVKGLH